MTTRLIKLTLWAAAAFWLFLTLVLVEGSFGHDGLLCEWGYTLHSKDNGCE